MNTYRMNIREGARYAFEIGPIRPPSEGRDQSLLIRATRNCPWNKCAFCGTYRGKRFEYRTVEEIKGDIAEAKALADELKAASWRLGWGGAIRRELVSALIGGNPEIYGQGAAAPELLEARFHSLVNVANWLASGARTVFLQDANTLIMRTPELVDVLRHIKTTFPTVERITSYARSETAARKALDELKALQQAGLSRLHIGLESGSDEVLNFIRKGVTAAQHIAGGRKVVEAGISLSEYVIPGLGGRRWSEQHARETARVLNAISPEFIRLRSLVIREGTDLHARFRAGEFEPLSEDEVIGEIRTLVESLECRSYLVSDHMANLLWEIEGHLPEDKAAILKVIDEYRSRPLPERLETQLKRRLQSHLSVHGGIESEAKEKVEAAFDAVHRNADSMVEAVETALAALKRGAM